MSGPVVYTCDLHSSVYHHLKAEGARGLALTHLDAHCDLKGSLVDRQAGRAWIVRRELPVTPSTFLAHLVAEGIVRDLVWVHDEVGGRENDLGTVLYPEDLDRLPHRLARRPRGPGAPVTYAEREYAAWTHDDPERVLDVDWDFFADYRKAPARTTGEIERLLEQKLTAAPLRTYVAYSSQYSRPGRDAYDAFVARLAARLSARVEPIPEAPQPRAGALARVLPPSLRRLLRSQALRAKRLLHR